MTNETILAERASPDPRVKWQGRIGSDRGRLELVVVIDFGTDTIAVPVLSDAELKALLTPPARPSAPWVCTECGQPNDSVRRWCVACSGHQVA
jgi:hypothetical protein